VSDGGRSATRTLRVAHRGDWRIAPENTVAALVAALRVPGCDGVEFDVRASRDDRSVLQHDETLLRVHARNERPRDLTVHELREAGVSTLEDVLQAVGGDAFLDIEVKDGPATDLVPLIERARGPALTNAVISSFWPAVLDAVRGPRPEWPRWLNAPFLNAATVQLARDLGCRGISVEWHAIDGPSLALAREAGLEVAAWTVTRRATFDRLARLGVGAVCVEGSALGSPRAPRNGN
jgi:glycerophosphoryl diester phosphodiesterase